MLLEDGHLYTAEQLCEGQVFGPDVKPETLKRATRRKENPLPCTRFPPGAPRARIYFTKANVEAIQAAGLQDVTVKRTPVQGAPPRRARLASVAGLPATTQRLTAKPEKARRSRRAS